MHFASPADEKCGLSQLQNPPCKLAICGIWDQGPMRMWFAWFYVISSANAGRMSVHNRPVSHTCLPPANKILVPIAKIILTTASHHVL